MERLLCSLQVMSDSLRLLCPWAFPGKNTGVGCHALLLQGISLIGYRVTNVTKLSYISSQWEKSICSFYMIFLSNEEGDHQPSAISMAKVSVELSPLVLFSKINKGQINLSFAIVVVIIIHHISVLLEQVD